MPTNMTILKSPEYTCLRICNIDDPKSLSLIGSAPAQSWPFNLNLRFLIYSLYLNNYLFNQLMFLEFGPPDFKFLTPPLYNYFLTKNNLNLMKIYCWCILVLLWDVSRIHYIIIYVCFYLKNYTCLFCNHLILKMIVKCYFILYFCSIQSPVRYFCCLLFFVIQNYHLSRLQFDKKIIEAFL